MAQRPMPKPDAAGRIFPVERPPVSTDAKKKPEKLAVIKDTVKPSRDYWTVIFSVLTIAAILFIGWRIEKIVWGQISAQNQHSITIPQKNTVTPPATNPIGTPNKQSTAISKTLSPKVDRTFEGPVVVQVVVGVDGKVKQARMIRGNPKFATAALKTVQQLSFTPYAPNGIPVEFETKVVVSQSNAAKETNEKIKISVPQQAEPSQATNP